MADWFEAGLLELGHQVTRSDSHLDNAAINILWEYFLPGFGSALRDTGVLYGIVATEIPDGDGFNWRREYEWLQRWQGFSEAAEGAAFIWTMVEETIPFYSQFAPTTYMELGFSEALVPALQPSPREIDFGFWGLATPYRLTVIERLQKYARVEWPQKLLSISQVQDFIAHIKIGLSFKQSEQWPVPSPTRLGRLLHAKAGVAAERTRITTRQSALVKTSLEGADFADFALEQLHSQWQEDADNAFAQYRQTMRMSMIMEQILDTTVFGNSACKIGTNTGKIKVRPFGPPRLTDTLNNYNIVEWQEIYYGLPQALGAVNLESQDVSQLPGVITAESVEDLKIHLLQEKIQQLESALQDSKLQNSRIQPEELSDHYPSPTLVEDCDSYNVVAWKGCFYGLPKALGSLDLASADATITEGVFVASSQADVKRTIQTYLKLEKQLEQTNAKLQVLQKSPFWILCKIWLRLKHVAWSR